METKTKKKLALPIGMDAAGSLKYKGIRGTFDYDAEEDSFVGSAHPTRHDTIIFEGATFNALVQDFKNAVNFYLS